MFDVRNISPACCCGRSRATMSPPAVHTRPGVRLQLGHARVRRACEHLQGAANPTPAHTRASRARACAGILVTTEMCKGDGTGRRRAISNQTHLHVQRRSIEKRQLATGYMSEIARNRPTPRYELPAADAACQRATHVGACATSTECSSHIGGASLSAPIRLCIPPSPPRALAR